MYNINNWMDYNNPNNYYNQYQTRSMAGTNPHYDIIKVHGEAGARNFVMGPNSKTLLLDETAPIIWFAQTDGTGYLQVTPFDFSPHQTQTPIDVNDLSARVAKLEELINNVQQSNPGDGSQQRQSKKRQSAPVKSPDTTD